MTDGLPKEGGFSANLTHFWHFSALMKRPFIPYFKKKSKRFMGKASLSHSGMRKDLKEQPYSQSDF